MPELADVEGWKRYANRFVRGSTVEAVRVPESTVLHDTTPQGLGSALHGRRFVDHRRRGKWLVNETDGPTLLVHFGMTGQLSFSSTPGPIHLHDRVLVELDRGRLTYRSQRMLGAVALVRTGSDVEEAIGPLGPDADAIEADELGHLLAGRRGAVKSTLMNQSLLAGVGNELSDEILWQARVHPDRPVAELDGVEIDRLHQVMQDVLRRAKRHGRIPEDPAWLESVRGEVDPRCPRCGAPIETVRSAGRTAYVCPAEQT